MELILIGIAFILFGVSWWWDWKKYNEGMHELLVAIDDNIKYMSSFKATLWERLDRIDHDNQQLKHRLTTIKRTTKKDLKAETKLSTPTVVVHTKPKKFRK